MRDRLLSRGFRLLLGLGLAVPAAATPQELDEEREVATLFARHCAMCHGERGRGDGPAAPHLEPAPRGFHRGSFLLVSTRNRIPTDDDLESAIRRGLPGSSMPSFSHLGEARIRALARFVRTLATLELARDISSGSALPGESIPLEVARRDARERLTPGEVLDPGPEAPSNDVTLIQGRALYMARCAVCHGRDGRGHAFPSSTPGMAVRDLRAGILKGEATHEALMHRILLGLPGSAMPAGLLERDEAAQVVTWMRKEMFPEDVATRQLQRRGTLRVKRIEGTLPSEGEDPLWQGAPSLDVVLAPLRWNDASLRHATLQALRNGEDIAIRVRYRDETRDDHLLAGAPFGDGAALQFARTDEPAFLGMGRIDAPSTLWHWKSFRMEKAAGFLDLVGHEPHGAKVDWNPSSYRPAPGILTLDEEARALSSEELGKLQELAREGLLVTCHPRWKQGTWDIVFTRALRPNAEELAFERGTPLWISLALWNGAAEEWGARKSVSLWHRLDLDDP